MFRSIPKASDGAQIIRTYEDMRMAISTIHNIIYNSVEKKTTQKELEIG